MLEYLLTGLLRGDETSSRPSELEHVGGAHAAPDAPSYYAEIAVRLDALDLACAGLWQFLKLRHGYTDEELVSVINEVDARDGKADHKYLAPLESCPSCRRTISRRKRPHCIWCGAALPVKPF